MSKKDRTLGALLGAHAGDALGSTYEFHSWSDLRKAHPNGIPHRILGGGLLQWPAGHATDDTDMLRAVLLAYKQRREDPTFADSAACVRLATEAANYMLDWYEGRWPGRRPGSNPADIGGATRSGLTAYAATLPRDPRRGGAGQGKAGNGSLMRCIPTALFATGTPMVQQSALISAVTHDDARCVLACAAYNVIAAALVAGCTPADAVDAGLALLVDDYGNDNDNTVDVVLAAFSDRDGTVFGTLTLENLRAALPQVAAAINKAKTVRVADLARLGPRSPPGLDAIPLGASGYVLETLTVAIAAVLDTQHTAADLLVDVVAIGLDCDTNAAVAGGLLGARDGVGGFPQSWRNTLQFASEFADIVNLLMPDE